MNPIVINESFVANFNEDSNDSVHHMKHFEESGKNWMKTINLSKPTSSSKMMLCHFEPGFGINLCNQSHLGYILSGSMKITSATDNNLCKTYKAGDVLYIPKNHTHEIEGEEVCEGLFLKQFYPSMNFDSLGLFQKNILSDADEKRELGSLATVYGVKLNDNLSIGLAKFKPGWKWSKDVKPLVKTDLCEMSHLGYVLQGEIMILQDNKQIHVKPGDVYCLPPHHDAYVEGNKDWIALDFLSLGGKYGKEK